MDEVAEQQEIANEISDAISNPVGFGQDQDEVRLLASTPQDTEIYVVYCYFFSSS